MSVLSMAEFRKRGLSGRENGLAKRFETTVVGKWTIFFGFVRGCTHGSAVAGLRVATLGGGSLGALVRKKVLRVRIAVVPEVPPSFKALGWTGFWISWMRSSTSNEVLFAEEVAGMRIIEGRNWMVFPKRVPLVADT